MEKSIEQAFSLGLDTSNYKFEAGQWWCSANDAHNVICAINPGKDVKRGYLKNPVSQGKVRKLLFLPPRGYVYNLEDLLKVEVQESRGIPAGTKLPYKPHQLSEQAKKNWQAAQKKRREREREEKENAGG